MKFEKMLKGMMLVSWVAVAILMLSVIGIFCYTFYQAIISPEPLLMKLFVIVILAGVTPILLIACWFGIVLWLGLLSDLYKSPKLNKLVSHLIEEEGE